MLFKKEKNIKIKEKKNMCVASYFVFNINYVLSKKSLWNVRYYFSLMSIYPAVTIVQRFKTLIFFNIILVVCMFLPQKNNNHR